MISYDAYIAEWNGRQVTKYGSECVAGIAEYESENGLPIVWGDAHTWINNPTMLGAYEWIPNNPNDANQLPTRGDIIVWGLPNEHIAFYDRNVSGQYLETFGQNSGGPTMHFQQNHWAGVAGWYTPKVAPPPPAAEVHPYTIENITPKDAQLTHEAHRWGLNYDNFTAINNNPEDTKPVNYVFTARAILHHNIGYRYYLEDPNVASGYNVLDCVDYNPPQPATPPAPTPEPVPVYVPPAAPLPVPRPQKYTLTHKVRAFNTATDAGNLSNARGTMAPGEYYVFNVYPDKPSLMNLSLDNMKPGAWINTDEIATLVSVEGTKLSDEQKQAIKDSWNNTDAPPTTPPPIITKPEVVPDTEAKVRSSIMWFMPDHSAIECKVKKTVMASEVFSKRAPITLEKDREYQVFATFDKDNRCYALLRLRDDLHFENLYGVPVQNHTSLEPYLDDIYSVADHIKYGFERAYDTLHKTIDGFFKPRKRNK